MRKFSDCLLALFIGSSVPALWFLGLVTIGGIDGTSMGFGLISVAFFALMLLSIPSAVSAVWVWRTFESQIVHWLLYLMVMFTATVMTSVVITLLLNFKSGSQHPALELFVLAVAWGGVFSGLPTALTLHWQGSPAQK